MEVVVLAVTRAFGKFCIAGMTLDGEWIRPIPQPGMYLLEQDRFWDEDKITFDETLIQTGDRITIEGYAPSSLRYSNHSEDFITTGMKKTGHFDVQELIQFLDSHKEDYQSFKKTVYGNDGRSLCLIEVEDFFCHVNRYDDGNTRYTMSFTHSQFNVKNPITNAGTYVVKDRRWEDLMKSNSVPNLQHNRLFLCIGLATPYKGVEYPMAIGLIPDYVVPVTVSK